LDRFLAGVKYILFSIASRPVLRSTQPPIQWILRFLSSGVKRPGLEVDHSPPTSDEFMKTWICKFTPRKSSRRST
jgi:hypothetical protein